MTPVTADGPCILGLGLNCEVMQETPNWTQSPAFFHLVSRELLPASVLWPTRMTRDAPAALLCSQQRLCFPPGHQDGPNDSRRDGSFR